MTALRSKFIKDLVIRGLSKRTQRTYSTYVADLAKYYKKSPDLLTYEQVTDWILYLIQERKLARSTVNVAVNAVRFFYGTTLNRDVAPITAAIPRMKRNKTRAEVYSHTELAKILNAPFQPRDRAFLMVVYGAGLRLSEAINLQISDIDRSRGQLRIRNGKGAKERVVPISERLLQELTTYWKAQRAGQPRDKEPWLFLGSEDGQPMTCSIGQSIYYRAVKRSGVRRKEGIHTLRHSFATHLIESGVEITLVQRLLGHSNLATTIGYLHVTTHRLEEVRSALDLIEKTLSSRKSQGNS